MYIRQEGRHIEIYENGIKLNRKESVKLVREHLEMAEDEESRDVLQTALQLLEAEERSLS